jgi:hypothetical protein
MMATCRFCKEYISDTSPILLKYGTRHYAHWRCYLGAGKGLGSLKPWQIAGAPFGPLREFGLLDAAQAIVDAADFAAQLKRRLRGAS